MPGSRLRVLCVHGVGGHPASASWENDWTEPIAEGLTRWNAALEVRCEFAYYDEIFDEAGIELGDTTAALWKLLGSGVGRTILVPAPSCTTRYA